MGLDAMILVFWMFNFKLSSNDKKYSFLAGGGEV